MNRIFILKEQLLICQKQKWYSIMEEWGIVACICEGSGEQAIIELLLDNNILEFSKQDLLEDKVIRVRSAAKFEEMYLRKQFDKKITIVRILDSRKENFKLSKLYKNKVKVMNIITAPEIEMLIIHNENAYEHFKKTGSKPSEYCRKYLGYKDVKNYQFVRDYFSNIDTLLGAIKTYRKKANVRKGEMTLFDLLVDKR